jgi:uncharacterized protein (DUF2235 family)
VPKNIALFIDGTNNKCVDPKRLESTNVCKLYNAASETASQLKKYVTGVGVGRRRIAGKVGGAGTRGNVQEAYGFLSENYRPGDNVYLFGFSRGALAARSLAGFADSVGLLLAGTKLEYVDEAYALYEDGMDGAHSRLRKLLRKMTGKEQPDIEEGTVLPIYFIGVWDTVAALGLPGRGKRLSAPFTSYHQTELPSNVTYARHALSLHDLRRSFEPLLWMRTSPRNPKQSLRQVWFAGAHADVGGGYDKTHWSDIALDWMTEEATNVGFQIAKPFPSRTAAVTTAIHHEIKGVFRGSIPTVRQVLKGRVSLKPETMKTFEIHRSVVQRLLTQGATKYTFRDRVDRKLRDVDEISLQLFFEILFRGP